MCWHFVKFSLLPVLFLRIICYLLFIFYGQIIIDKPESQHSKPFWNGLTYPKLLPDFLYYLAGCVKIPISTFIQYIYNTLLVNRLVSCGCNILPESNLYLFTAIHYIKSSLLRFLYCSTAWSLRSYKIIIWSYLQSTDESASLFPKKHPCNAPYQPKMALFYSTGSSKPVHSKRACVGNKKHPSNSQRLAVLLGVCASLRTVKADKMGIYRCYTKLLG